MPDDVDVDDLAVSTTRQTNELIEQIAYDSSFAQAVKSFHVMAHTVEQGLDPEDTSSGRVDSQISN